ncbi:MAG: GNAT family N-acetyltransferase [Tissierellia bacterium]|jgi:RimJ/RimL family protein N-acetyltransferase|nr:GNAT family N-acetyltransferase [Tissierellia bacterium]MDD4046558.1 GNAT family N-acetyltransferase [Tissierellia bacterium]MDD4678646.1 GNAT family N-acetyltransferase [Tissierellia bacterium]
MIFNEKTITLKNGEVCVLRSPNVSDAEAMLDYLKKTATETDFLLRYPEEVVMTIEEEEFFLNSLRENPRSIMICAFIDDKLVGTTHLSAIGERFKIYHRASFGIAVLEEAWNLGIGKAFITEILKFAEDTGFELVELEVASTNYNAIELYKKFGFKIYGTRENGFKFKDGTYCDEHLMLKKIK